MTVVNKPKCKLVGTDGNVFALIGRVSGCLKKAGLKEEAKEFTEKAFSAEDYNHVLVIIKEYVDIE